MALNTELMRAIYDCKTCKKKSCTKIRKRAVQQFDCICNGDKRCQICKGKNLFGWYSCPSTVLNEFSIRRVLSSFYHYQESKQYPDLRGQYYQPIILLEAFDLLSMLSMKQLKKEAKNVK